MSARRDDEQVAGTTRGRTFDSDAHVIEIPFTWEFMTEAERKYAPFSVAQDGGTEYGVERA